jgi:uncharacterized protein YjaZ
MFKDSKEGQTNYCTHENNNPSGICDECLPKEIKEWNKEAKEIVDFTIRIARGENNK